MTVQDVQNLIASRIKTLTKKVQAEDPELSDRDWDIMQERNSSAINELARLQVEIDRARSKPR
jgi:hypothetical protein